MIKKLTFFPMLLIMIFVFQGYLFGDTRTENIELYLVIDKSKSMVEEISDVSSYINRNFIENFLIPGDRLVLIQFYGKADLIYDHVITADGKAELARQISSLRADGRFTDIGNALDRLNSAVDGAGRIYDRQYLILLTDGKQEAPPESPYYSPDGSFNHRFLENTKIIQRSGWKVIIIGIGSDTIVEELAEEIGTTYEAIDFSGDSEVRDMPASEIIGRVTASGFSVDGNSISLTLASEGYKSKRSIVIEQISYQTGSGNYDLIETPFSADISPDSRIDLKIPLSDSLVNRIEGGNADGTLIFKFTGDTPFLPAVFDSVYLGHAAGINKEEKTVESEKKPGDDVDIRVNWLIIIIVILAVAAVVAFIIIRNIIFHRDDDENKPGKKDEIPGNS